MFTAFNEGTFWKAIKEKDYLRLKVYTMNSILNDPTFARGETEEVLQILDREVPEIFEDEIWLDYEERLDHSLWDKRYFTKLTYWFQENFAKGRIPYIKEVGQAVHQDTARKYAESMKIGTSPVSEKKTTKANTNPPQAPAAKVQKFPVVGVIAAVAALVLVIVLLVKLLGK